MQNYLRGFFSSVQEVFFVGLSITCLGIIGFPSSSGSQSVENEYFSDSDQLEIHNTFSADENDGHLLDVSNQMDLMHRLRHTTSMENATSPSDAIDQALRALDSQSLEDPLME